MSGLFDLTGQVCLVIGGNGGMSTSQPSLFDIDTEQFNRVMEVNLNGVFFTLREAARHIIKRAEVGDAGGALVGIASTAAIHGAARNEHYAASKAAL